MNLTKFGLKILKMGARLILSWSNRPCSINPLAPRSSAIEELIVTSVITKTKFRSACSDDLRILQSLSFQRCRAIKRESFKTRSPSLRFYNPQTTGISGRVILRALPGSRGTWEYCDPAIERTEGPRLEEPKEPTLQPVKSLAESLVELALSDLTSLHSLAAQYKADLAHYHKARRAMDDLPKNHHGIYIQLNMDLCSKMCTASLTKS